MTTIGVERGVPDQVVPDYPPPRECPHRPAAATAQLRAAGPVRRVRLYDGRTTWLVTGPAEARALLADPRMSSRADFPDYPVLDPRHLRMRATREMAKEEEGGFAGALFGVDPPEHTRQRRALLAGFTARRVARHRPAVERIVDELLATMLAAGPGADLVEAFAAAVPLRVVCTFLGLPYAERARFEGPAKALFDPEQAGPAGDELAAYLARLITSKVTAPGDGLLDDLIASRAAGRTDVTDEELVAFALAVLVAGTVTSTNTIALGTLALLEDRTQFATLAADPDLVPGAVEEILRHVSLVEQLTRVAVADIEVGDVVIRAGQGVLISFACANLDETVTTHPGLLDVTRPPQNHLAFSHGIHHCMGHNLARLQLGIAFRALVTAIPTLRLAIPAADVSWYDDGTVPRVLSLPVTW